MKGTKPETYRMDRTKPLCPLFHAPTPAGFDYLGTPWITEIMVPYDNPDTGNSFFFVQSRTEQRSKMTKIKNRQNQKLTKSEI